MDPPVLRDGGTLVVTGYRLLFVHAHPDDEASKGAATAARYVDEGHDVVLVTCTGGEAGEVLNPQHPEVAPAELPHVRAAELATAVAVIGFTRSYLLGYRDSGLPDDPADVPPGSFAAIDVDEPAADLAAILRRERPHVVVTYPPDGGYPHPDHVRTHAVAVRAVELASEPGPDGAHAWHVPRLVFSTGFPLERTRALHDALVSRGGGSPYAEWIERAEQRGPRDADAPPDVRVDVHRWFSRRDDALRAHATQVDPAGSWFQIPRDLEAEVFPWETYVLVRGVGYPDGADDLLAGLRAEG
jgi:mycothiol S-conjugate amidase